MQSYMNSLKESATMDIESSPVSEAPPSPAEVPSKEAIRAITRAYQDISSSSQDRAAKSELNITNLPTTSLFKSNTSQETSYTNGSSHLGSDSTQGYQSCPAGLAPHCPDTNDNHHTFPSVDKSRYSCPATLSNHDHGQSNVGTTQRGSSANHNSFSMKEETQEPQTQTSCPWKLAAGTKVLVSKPRVVRKLL